MKQKYDMEAAMRDLEERIQDEEDAAENLECK